MPESRTVTLKARLASEVTHIRQLRPDGRIVAIADCPANNWAFLKTLSPETEVIDFWRACEHLRTASDHAVASDWFDRYREVLRHDACDVDKVIRALRHLGHVQFMARLVELKLIDRERRLVERCIEHDGFPVVKQR